MSNKMQKSFFVNLKDIVPFGSTDDSNDSLCFNEEEEEDDKPNIYSKTIQQNLNLFKIQDFLTTHPIESPDIDDYQYDILENNDSHLQTKKYKTNIKCVLTMVSSVSSSRNTSSSPIFMWENVSSIPPLKYNNFAKNYMNENYSRLSTKIRSSRHMVNPNIESIKNLAKVNGRDVPSDCILFHYIGYGFPPHDQSSIPCLDPTGIFKNYPIRTLFESIKTPSFYIFDCSNAGAALRALQVASNSQHPIPRMSLFQNNVTSHNTEYDWKDYFCLCSTDIEETLPEDPHLPRDFLTSCIFTPVKLAIICHVIQYYRTTIVTDKFPMKKFIDINIEGLEETLQAIIDSIASDVLSIEEYRRLFRSNELISYLFRQFLLCQFLLKYFQVHPISYPELPDLSTHQLWGNWQTIADFVITKITTESFGFITNIFNQTINSVEMYLKNECKQNDIPTSLITLLFNIPEKSEELLHNSFILLSKYASISQNARNKLTKTTIFPKLFKILIKNNNNNSIDFKMWKHSLCYLCISILQTDESLINNINLNDDIHTFKEKLFDPKIPIITKSMISAILSFIIPYNESLQFTFSSKQFISKISNLLNTYNDSLFILWTLVLISKIFDSYGIDSKIIYELGLHIQIASFCFHNSYEIRSISLSILSYLIQTEDKVNVQLFCLALKSIFDISYLVRYNYLIFLGNFLTNYQLESKDLYTKINLTKNSIKNIINNYLNVNEISFEEHSKDFKKLCSFTDIFTETENSLQKCIKLSIELINILQNDTNNIIRNISKQILTTFNYTEKSNEKCFNIFIKQMISFKYWEIKEETKVISTPITLPQPTLTNIPTTKLVKTFKYKFNNSEIPNNIKYDHKTLSITVSTTKNNIYYFDEKYLNIKKLFIGSKISAINISDWDYNNSLIFIGSENGFVNVWNPNNLNPKISFFADLSDNSNTNFPLVLTLINTKKQFITARGNTGIINLWDIEYQKLISSFKTNKNNEIITTINMNPISENVCVAGYDSGLITSMDLRSNDIQNIEEQKIKNDKIMKIIGCLGNNNKTKFFAGTYGGKCVSWENIDDISVIEFDNTNSMLNDFDVHTLSPFMSLAPTKSFPVITDWNGNVIHTLKDIGTNALCSFHPVLPHIMWGTSDGKLVESKLTTV